MPLDAMYIKGEPPTKVGGVEVQRSKQEEEVKGGRDTCKGKQDRPPHVEGQQPRKRIRTKGPEFVQEGSTKEAEEQGAASTQQGEEAVSLLMCLNRLRPGEAANEEASRGGHKRRRLRGKQPGSGR